MIEIQVPCLEAVATILAGKAVPLENALAGKADFAEREAVIFPQDNHRRDAHLGRDRVDHIPPPVRTRMVQPRAEIVEGIAGTFVSIDNVGVIDEK